MEQEEIGLPTWLMNDSTETPEQQSDEAVSSLNAGIGSVQSMKTSCVLPLNVGEQVCACEN
jgi:hypothetical protein